METQTLWVCVDCYQFTGGISALDRGEDYPRAVLEAMDRIGSDGGELVPGIGVEAHIEECQREYDAGGDFLCDGACETIGFSWSRCDACLSPLGGSRHGVTLFWGE